MKHTKHKLLSSIATLFVCLAMFIGSTYAWFTDSASTGVNKIQAGNLDIQLLAENGTTSLEGKTLKWVKASGHQNEEVLWEPGASYNLESFYVKNNGNLNLKYKIAITGIKGDAELNNVIDWTMIEGNSSTPITINGSQEFTLAPGAISGLITINGKMQESAGNNYQGKSIDGISITVYATQATGESDSFGNDYDSGAEYVERTATIMGDDGKTITLESGKTYTVGNATVTVEANGDISYVNPGAAQTVSITTNGGRLTINAPLDTVNHYGVSEFVDVNAIAGQSFHEFGKVGVLSVIQGRVVAENGNNFDVIQVKGNSAVVAVPENKTLETKLEKSTEVSQITLKVINSVGSEVAFKTTENGKVDGSIPEELKEVLSNNNSTINNAQDYVARVGNVYYGTLDAAINAANNGDTITLLKDSIGKGIGSKDGAKGRDSLTIDFNGHTYTMNDPAVGSTGTESQAMHWGRSLGAVTLKNGTFKVAEGTTQVNMAMQNYINFTAENMTFDFTTIPVDKYGDNQYTGANAVYNGLEIPMFNNGTNGTMTLKNCTVSMPENSIKGIDNYGNDLVIESSTINGAVVIEYENSAVKVKSSVITKGVSPYFNSGYTVKTSEKDGYTVYTNQTVVNASDNEQLTDAINQNSEVTVKLTKADTYDLPEMSDKEVSIIGTKDTVIDMKNKINTAKSISFEGVTVNFGTDNYRGFQHTGKLTYRDCTITGMQFLYADEVEFNNCVFEQDIVEYNVWTYGAKNVLFKDCTLNCAGKSVLIYNEGSNGQTVEFKNCKFNATAQANGKAAIEIDSSLLKNDDIYTVIIDQATANSVSGFSMGSVSNNSVWNNKKGSKATVIVAGSTVLSAS